MNPIPAARIVIPADDRREILARIDEALRTGALTLGRNGEAFEAAFARVVGARFAIAVQSGTSALEIVLRSLGVDGREVIVPTNTFFATPAAFSFYPTKVITAGEGGMIVTDDEEIHRQALQYRGQGKEGFLTNFHVRLGYNWRLSELHAILGLSQLGRLEEFVAERRRVASAYGRRLAAVSGVEPLLPPEGSRSNFYKYPVLLERGVDRPALKRALKERFQVSLSGEV